LKLLLDLAGEKTVCPARTPFGTVPRQTIEQNLFSLGEEQKPLHFCEFFCVKSPDDPRGRKLLEDPRGRKLLEDPRGRKLLLLEDPRGRKLLEDPRAPPPPDAHSPITHSTPLCVLFV
jgi:hypothetical protein